AGHARTLGLRPGAVLGLGALEEPHALVDRPVPLLRRRPDLLARLRRRGRQQGKDKGQRKKEKGKTERAHSAPFFLFPFSLFVGRRGNQCPTLPHRRHLHGREGAYLIVPRRLPWANRVPIRQPCGPCGSCESCAAAAPVPPHNVASPCPPLATRWSPA